jgi:AAA15 family ATPase/GTPase
MSDFFNSVHITNFKSLKDVTLSDCKRINLLIGKPNVGKSNILEAIGLFCLPCLHYNKVQDLTQFIRYENLPELFFDGDVSKAINVQVDDGSYCKALYSEQNGSVSCQINNVPGSNRNVEFIISDDYSIKADNPLLLIKSLPPKTKFYKFSQNSTFGKSSVFLQYLLPPYGINIFEILQVSKELKKNLATIFSIYGLKLLFDKSKYTLRLMKALDEDNIISFPYSSIADTLQRLIFFKAAIASNNNSIILFEEPEAHCFPPYIRQITQDIIDSETNQFFIATHSPYVLNDFLEYERNDVAIFIANFKNGETVIRRLTDEEVNDVYQYGIDLFFNHELFTDDQEH